MHHADQSSQYQQELFADEFTRVNLGTISSGKPGSGILPTFYSAPPTESDDLRQKLREEARAQFLQVLFFVLA